MAGGFYNGEAMRDELKAAIQQYRDRAYPDTNDGWCDCDADAKIIADAYLAEHPADDDEPASEAWLTSVKWEAVGNTWYCMSAKEGQPILMWVRVDGSLRIAGLKEASRINATRGDVRLLCRALGIELTETTIKGK